MAKKVASGVIAVLVLGLVALVRFAPGTAQKLGLDFLVKASEGRNKDQKQTPWYTCSLDVQPKGPAGRYLPFVLGCTVKQNTLLRGVKVRIAGKKRNIVEEDLIEEVQITPDKPWQYQGKLKIRGFGMSSDTRKRMSVTALFFYPDQKLPGIISDPRDPNYDMNKNTEIEEADQKKYPDKYKLLLMTSAEW